MIYMVFKRKLVFIKENILTYLLCSKMHIYPNVFIFSFFN